MILVGSWLLIRHELRSGVNRFFWLLGKDGLTCDEDRLFNFRAQGGLTFFNNWELLSLLFSTHRITFILFLRLLGFLGLIFLLQEAEEVLQPPLFFDTLILLLLKLLCDFYMLMLLLLLKLFCDLCMLLRFLLLLDILRSFLFLFEPLQRKIDCYFSLLSQPLLRNFSLLRRVLVVSDDLRKLGLIRSLRHIAERHRLDGDRLVLLA